MVYEFVEHTADVKIKVVEKTLDEAFKTSAIALKQVIAEDVNVKSKQNKILSMGGKDLQDLLYSFLEEFLYLLDAEDFLLSEIEDLEVSKTDEGYFLSATVSGDKASNYKFTNDVKAITFNDMKIEGDKNKYAIQFVLDV